jgi:hypothetical protein
LAWLHSAWLLLLNHTSLAQWALHCCASIVIGHAVEHAIIGHAIVLHSIGAIEQIIRLLAIVHSQSAIGHADATNARNTHAGWWTWAQWHARVVHRRPDVQQIASASRLARLRQADLQRLRTGGLTSHTLLEVLIHSTLLLLLLAVHAIHCVHAVHTKGALLLLARELGMYGAWKNDKGNNCGLEHLRNVLTCGSEI